MIQHIPDIQDSLLFRTDSYKLSHWTQYPKGLTSMMSYLEARGGRFADCTLVDLQPFLHQYMSRPVTYKQIGQMVDFAAAHGEPFNASGFGLMVQKHGGHWPVRIRAIPEGTVVPVKNAVLTVESTDPELPWVASYLETALVRLWGPSTVAIAGREVKKVIKRYLDATSDTAEADLPFKFHDFGGRGVFTAEQAGLAGCAHLFNFMGSDTIEGIRYANHYYHAEMAGFSIPASEHSTASMLGRQGEMELVEAYIQRELVDRQLPAGVPKLASYVGDTFDIYEFTQAVTTGRLKDMIKSSGGTFVIRPDSGNPIEVLSKVVRIIHHNLRLDCHWEKGFVVFPDYIRVIQGDGVDIDSVEKILDCLTSQGYSAKNIAFGSGGGNLQKWNRDTQKWKLACCAATIDGKEVAVQKDPITDPGKRSKAGRLDLVKMPNGEFKTTFLNNGARMNRGSVLRTVYENGEILVDTTLDECRARMAL